MIVDLLRSAYTANVKFWKDSAQTVPITWYFVPNDRPIMPYPTIFSSYNYDKGNGWDRTEVQGTVFQGEQLDGVRPHANGLVPTGVDPYNGPGQLPCGTRDQWAGNLTLAGNPPVGLDVIGNPLCCSRLYPTSFTFNPSCGNPAFPTKYNTYWVEPAGLFRGDSSCPCFQAVFQMTYQGRCQWLGARTCTLAGFAPNVSALLSYGFLSSAWSLTFYHQGNEFANYNAPATADPTKPMVFTKVFDSGACAGWANTQTVYPGVGLMNLIGQVVWDAGTDAIPGGFLLCDGSAVSRSVYSLLFGRLGSTFGPGDGSTTFNLPDLRDKVALGSLNHYATGQLVGNDSPTLTANQLPAHTHPITDPSHVHTTNGRAGLPLYVGFNSGSHINAATGTSNIDAETMDAATTGITVNANVTAGNPLDVRQQSVALRPLIFAGV